MRERESGKRLKGYSNNGLQLIMFMHTRANPLAGRQYGLTLTHTQTDRHTLAHTLADLCRSESWGPRAPLAII